MKSQNGASRLPDIQVAPPQGPMAPSPEMVALGNELQAAHNALVEALVEGEGDLWPKAKEALQRFQAVQAKVTEIVRVASARQAAQRVAVGVATEEQIALAVAAAKEAKEAVLNNPGNGAQWLQLGWTLVLMPEDGGMFRLTAKLLEPREVKERDFSYLGRVCQALGVPAETVADAIKETPDHGVYSFRWLVPETMISKGGQA